MNSKPSMPKANPRFAASGWFGDAPTEAGIYEIRCAENFFIPERVTVYRRRTNGIESLWVNDPELGCNPLEHFHNGLINLEWRKSPNDQAHRQPPGGNGGAERKH
jgi:hypothetical protein